MRDDVWLLWFEEEHNRGDDAGLLIGAYRTEESAEAAIKRLNGKAGFRDNLAGFHIYPRPLDEDSWTEGFARVGIASQSDEEIDFEVGAPTVQLSLSARELDIVQNALNEICNGTSLQNEFETRIGSSLEAARILLGRISNIRRN